jgi:Signal transduction histidine kinase
MPVSSLHDEFDEVAATLNQMLDRIEGLLENLRQVSSDIAHDLRTPLARLRNRLERGNLERSNSSEIIADAIRQVDEVLSVFGAILRIAEIESGETRRFFKPFDLSALLTELAESYVPAFSDEGRTLRYEVTPGVTLDGEGELLVQGFANLLENAQRHTPKGTVASLALASDGNWIRGTVADNGTGVAEADKGSMAASSY